MANEAIIDRLSIAVDERANLFEPRHETAFRLFNGFVEGCRSVVIDLYARTLVLYNYADDSQEAQPLVEVSWHYLVERLPWVQAVIVKTRNADDDQARRGLLVYGDKPNRKIREHGLWYAVDLMLNLDASLYLDTRNLRAWAIDHHSENRRLQGKRVLNTFAYTGSLGVAAMGGKARQVIQLDLNRRFLNLSKDSFALNGFPVRRADFRERDFWELASQLRRKGELFDCVFVDPPYFSSTTRGTVDLVSQSQQVINKARPLVGHNGWLVVTNNALFVSGLEFMRLLEDLCADGYLEIEEIIPVPPDFTGFPGTRASNFPVDPAPFNHPTKIAVLRVRRKDEMTADRKAVL